MSAPLSSQPYYDLGGFHCHISTRSSECQAWFDRGLIWTYAFNHDEAVKCFQYAIDHDHTCPMAYWGLAYAVGPNYNKQWGLFDPTDLAISLKRAYHAAKNAAKYTKNATVVEQALVKAIQSRYQEEVPQRSYTKWNIDYANEMKAVYDQFPNDLDVAALCSDALINLTPWALWNLKTGQPGSRARTLEAKAILESALACKTKHAGVLHLYIHLMEMSPQPELALNAADQLRDLIPDAGHLRHMPSHIDILVGDYRQAIASNTVAILADEKYLTLEGVHHFYTMYRSHNYHSLIYAAMFAGKANVALKATSAMEESIPESLLRVQSPPMADWLEYFVSIRPHVLIRFGRWDEISTLHLPLDQNLYCVTTATIHYAKAIAAAAQGRIDEATIEQKHFEVALGRVASSRWTTTNRSAKVLIVGKAMLAGELEYRKRNFTAAFTYLEEAVKLDDSLVYSEPWAWMLPTRHAFAALLLEQGKVEKAASLYRADLGFDRTLPRARQHPNNVWALHGYHECLKKLGRHAEADLLQLQLQIALAVADIPIQSSCFCRRSEPRSLL